MTLDEAKKAMVKFVELKTTLRPAFVGPILNAVEVVRCKDCVYATKSEWSHLACTVNSEPNLFCKSEDYFCAWGKRKDNG